MHCRSHARAPRLRSRCGLRHLHPEGSLHRNPADIFTTAAVPGRSAALDVCVASSFGAAARGDAAQAAFDRKLSHYRNQIGEQRQQGFHFRPLVTIDGQPHPAVTRTLQYAANIASSRNGQQVSAKSPHRRWKRDFQIALLRRRAGHGRIGPGHIRDRIWPNRIWPELVFQSFDRIWPNRIWPELVFLVFWPSVGVCSRFWVCSRLCSRLCVWCVWCVLCGVSSIVCVVCVVGVFKIFDVCLEDFWWVSSRFWWVSSRFLVGVFKIFGGCLQDFWWGVVKIFGGCLQDFGWCLQDFWVRCRRGFTRQPENSKRAHFRVPAFKNTKIQRKDPQEREERMKIVTGDGKKSAILGGPAEGRSGGGGGPGKGGGSGGAHKLDQHTQQTHTADTQQTQHTHTADTHTADTQNTHKIDDLGQLAQVELAKVVQKKKRWTPKTGPKSNWPKSNWLKSTIGLSRKKPNWPKSNWPKSSILPPDPPTTRPAHHPTRPPPQQHPPTPPPQRTPPPLHQKNKIGQMWSWPNAVWPNKDGQIRFGQMRSRPNNVRAVLPPLPPSPLFPRWHSTWFLCQVCDVRSLWWNLFTHMYVMDVRRGLFFFGPNHQHSFTRHVPPIQAQVRHSCCLNFRLLHDWRKTCFEEMPDERSEPAGSPFG